MRPTSIAPKPCASCALDFTPRDASKARSQLYCSRQCWADSKRVKQPALQCERCNQDYTPKDSHEAKTRRFCSGSCAVKATHEANPDRPGPMTGKKHSEAARKAIAAANMRRWMRIVRPGAEVRQCTQCQTDFPMTNGSKPSRRFCSKSCAAKAQPTGPSHPNWKNGRNITTSGYVQIRTLNPDGTYSYELEHRAVMERLIGRSLVGDENVHHKNGDRTDNRPENLELWATSQPSGQRVADKVAWAKEILALYDAGALALGGQS